MKKAVSLFLVFILSMAMLVSFAACSSTPAEPPEGGKIRKMTPDAR